MDYCRYPNRTIDIEDHLNVLDHLLTTPKWSSKEYQEFFKWFKFEPPSGGQSSDKKLFTHSFILMTNQSHDFLKNFTINIIVLNHVLNRRYLT